MRVRAGAGPRGVAEAGHAAVDRAPAGQARHRAPASEHADGPGPARLLASSDVPVDEGTTGAATAYGGTRGSLEARNAAVLADPRLGGHASGAQRAGLLRALQQSLGNQHVARVIARARPATRSGPGAVQRTAAAPPGEEHTEAPVTEPVTEPAPTASRSGRDDQAPESKARTPRRAGRAKRAAGPPVSGAAPASAATARARRPVKQAPAQHVGTRAPEATRGFEVPGPDAADDVGTPSGSPRAEAAGPAEPPSLLAQLPTTFRSPGIRAAVQGIVQAGGAEKARLRQAAAARRLVIGTHAESQAQTLLEQAQTSARSVAAAAEATGAETEATFATGRERLQAEANRQQAAAVLDADQALADLDAGLAAQREDTRQAAEQDTENIEQAGGAEAARATESAETTAQEIFRGARQEKGEATGDDDVQEAVGDAVDQLAADAVGEVQANGSEFAEQSQAAARETAAQLDQSEGVLLDAFEAGGSLLEGALGRGSAAALGALAHASAQQVQLLESRRNEVLDALEHGKSSAATTIRSAGHRAADQTRQAGEAALARSRQDEEDACLAVDQGARAVVEHLSQLDEQYDLDEAAVPEVVESVGRALADGATGLDRAQEPPSAEVRARLNEGAALFEGRLQDAEQQARGSLDRLGGPPPQASLARRRPPRLARARSWPSHGQPRRRRSPVSAAS